jgi:hypothetical protein
MVFSMDRLDRLDRRARYSLGGAVAFAGVLLLVLGWYLISGQALAAKQLPYLASASLPGAALLVCGVVVALTGADTEASRRIAELHSLLTEAVEAGPEPSGGASRTGSESAGTDSSV